MDFQVCRPQQYRVQYHLKTTSYAQQRYLQNGSSTHCHLIMKLMLSCYHSAIRSLSVFIAPKFTMVDKAVHSTAQLSSCCSCIGRMRTRGLVPKRKTTVIGLGARLVHVHMK